MLNCVQRTNRDSMILFLYTQKGEEEMLATTLEDEYTWFIIPPLLGRECYSTLFRMTQHGRCGVAFALRN
jgi:hypothetical protein